ncbi:hypothetical protein, partial [Micromonospora sp. H61]|uniref:hypothetical protein n=1 Tax=Micromonospora sp. H61 TaxID=2824888 RepID=UPI001FFD1A2C
MDGGDHGRAGADGLEQPHPATLADDPARDDAGDAGQRKAVEQPAADEQGDLRVAVQPTVEVADRLPGGELVADGVCAAGRRVGEFEVEGVRQGLAAGERGDVAVVDPDQAAALDQDAAGIVPPGVRVR